MIAIAAGIIFLLRAFGVIDNTQDVDWVLVAAGLWAIHFGFDVSLPELWARRRTNA